MSLKKTNITVLNSRRGLSTVLNSKRGMSGETTRIILIFVVLVFAVLMIMVFKDTDVTDFKTLPCTFSNKLKGMLPSKVFNALPGTYGLMRFCTVQEKIIDPQGWTKCNAEFKAASDINPVDASRNCTMQQVLDLVLKCWDMGGRGKYHPGSFMCYYGVVKIGETEDFDIKDETRLRMLYEDDVRHELGCMAGQRDWCILDQLKEGCLCDKVVRYVADKHAKLIKANALVSYFHNLITNNNTATGLDSDGYLVYCAKEGVDVTELGGELFKLENPTETQVASLLYSSLDLKKEGCNESISRIHFTLKGIAEHSSVVDAAKSEIRAKLEGCVEEGEEVDVADVDDPSVLPAVVDYAAKAERISFLMDETARITASAPSLGMISQNDLREFAKRVKNVKTNTSYAFELGPDSMEFVGEYKLGPNSMFEMAYCDGAPIASGLLAMDACSISHDTIVQIGTVGSGVGGVGRAQSPLCHMTSVLSSIPGASYANDFCKGRYWKISRATQ